MPSSPDEPRASDSPVDIALDLAPTSRPIDEACVGLALEERLQLLLQVVDAVATAHRQLRLQPGLEPQQVRVTAPPPEALRFDRGALWGTAESAPRPLGTVLLTGQPEAPGAISPAFASPEQLRGETLSTASDVYSLGALMRVICTDPLPRLRADPLAPQPERTRLPGDLEAIERQATQPCPNNATPAPMHWPATCAATSRATRSVRSRLAACTRRGASCSATAGPRPWPASRWWPWWVLPRWAPGRPSVPARPTGWPNTACRACA